MHKHGHVPIHGWRDRTCDGRRSKAANARSSHCRPLHVSPPHFVLPCCYILRGPQHQLPRPATLPFSHLLLPRFPTRRHPNSRSITLRDRHRKRRYLHSPRFPQCLLHLLSPDCRVSTLSSFPRALIPSTGGMGIQNLDYQPDRTGYDCMRYVKSLTSNSSNSALYVSSRTLFTLAQRSSFPRIRNTIGRTNNGHTPLAAITVCFLPGALAFLAVRAKDIAFQEVHAHNPPFPLDQY